jgi:hypothetical protein
VSHVVDRSITPPFPDFPEWPLELPLASNDIARDIIEMQPLLTLGRGGIQSECGFIDRIGTPTCVYATHGYGCPVLGLSTNERQKRLETKIEDYCHRTFSRIKAGIASAEEIARYR